MLVQVERVRMRSSAFTFTFGEMSERSRRREIHARNTASSWLNDSRHGWFSSIFCEGADSYAAKTS